MSVLNPLTATSDIAISQTKNGQTHLASSVEPGSESPNKYKQDFAKDIVNISALGREKQQKEVQLETSRQIETIANEVIRVSSSIGKAKSSGALSVSQATALYNKISALL